MGDRGQPDALVLVTRDGRFNLHQVAMFHVPRRQIPLIHEQHVAPAENATITVVEPIDRCVVLIVTAQGREPQDVRIRKRGVLADPDERNELCLARFRMPNPFGRPEWQPESTRMADPLIIIFEVRIDNLDLVETSK